MTKDLRVCETEDAETEDAWGSRRTPVLPRFGVRSVGRNEIDVVFHCSLMELPPGSVYIRSMNRVAQRVG